MFFDRFRDAISRLPGGLVRLGPPASAGEIASAEAALGRTLPETFASFLRSFDGADLFHEAVVIAGVGPGATCRLIELDRAEGEIVFAETPSGDRFAFGVEGQVMRLRGSTATGDEERWLAGSGFEAWLEALVAHERLLYGPDGEFAPEAFEPEGAEVLPVMALRQAEKALKLDPGAAELHHERGVALRRLNRDEDAREAFRRAAALDPANAWPWFELGRAALDAGVNGADEATRAFERAAAAEAGESAARFWLWSARAALLLASPDRLAACRRQALALAPALAASLHHALDAAKESGDAEAIEEAEGLVAALEAPPGSARRRLPVVQASEPPALRPSEGAGEKKPRPAQKEKAPQKGARLKRKQRSD